MKRFDVVNKFYCHIVWLLCGPNALKPKVNLVVPHDFLNNMSNNLTSLLST